MRHCGVEKAVGGRSTRGGYRDQRLGRVERRAVGSVGPVGSIAGCLSMNSATAR